MNEGKNSREGGPKAQDERRRGGITPLARSHQGGGGGWWMDEHNFNGVEISSTGGIGEMVRDFSSCFLYLLLESLCNSVLMNQT